jgi:hypothetical protein
VRVCVCGGVIGGLVVDTQLLETINSKHLQ